MENIVYVLGVVCAVWVIYQVWAVNTSLSAGSKVIWTIFAILFNIITAIVYYFVGRK